MVQIVSFWFISEGYWMEVLATSWGKHGWGIV